MKTYFKLSREIFESAIWTDTPDLLKLFIYLIGSARFEKKLKKFHGFNLCHGEVVTSLTQIAENNSYNEFGRLQQWSKQKVSRMLKVLTQQGYINMKTDTYGTHISICNYGKYQDKETYKRTRMERGWNGDGTIIRM